MIAPNTPTATTFPELNDELEQLRRTSRVLSERLSEAAGVLRESGLPPSVELIDELETYRERMRWMAETLSRGNGDRLPTEITFDRLHEITECRRRVSITESLRHRLSQLRHVDTPDFAPLASCLNESIRLCDVAKRPAFGDDAHQIDLLVHERHPLNSLLRLADEGQQLSDQEWTECSDAVAAAFGRQLATALTRGRIRRIEPVETNHPLANETQPQAAPEPPKLLTAADLIVVESATVAAPTPVHPLTIPNAALPASGRTYPAVATTASNAPTSPEAPSPEPIAIPRDAQVHIEVSSESVFDSPRPRRSVYGADNGIEPSERGPSAKTLGNGASTTLNAPTAIQRDEPRAAPTQSAPSAHATSNGDDAHVLAVPTTSGSRAARISELVIRLLDEDRIPLALQLTRCLDLRPEPNMWSPPSWLLRSLILGRHLSYSKGEIARQLDDELRNFRPDSLSEGSEERQLTMGFLLRAAALPAALLTGSSVGSGILRAFKISPGFSQLYNYCSRIAHYGDRMGDGVMEMFRSSVTIAGATELKNLSTTARDWLQDTAMKAASYSRSSPLFLHAHWTLTSGTAIRHAEAAQQWCKWQETLLLAHRLLKPVCNGLDGERNWVRQEIVRLTSQIRVEPHETTQRNASNNSAGGRGIVLPSEEMHATLLEAIGMANRWLRLCNQSAPSHASPIPLEAIELRDEVLTRSASVINELDRHRSNAKSGMVRAAINCCQMSVRRIQALFESRLSLPLMEADPRHVLNGELLKIPGIELNEQWLPDIEPALCERELIVSLQQRELTWRQSFDLQAQVGNHDATGRLLELDVWESDEERNALRATREAQIAESRALLATELNELSHEINNVSDANSHSQADRAAYLQRLDVLRRELPRVLNFGPFRRRVNQLQSALHRRTLPLTSSALPATSVLDVSTDLRRGELVGAGTPRELNNLRDNPLLTDSIFHSANIFSGE